MKGNRGKYLSGFPVSARTVTFLLAFLFVFVLSASPGFAKKKDWQYGSGGSMDDIVWQYLLENEETLYPDSFYEPVMMLARDGETEAWLVATGDAAEEGSGDAALSGYLVVYIQLSPTPKIINIDEVGKPLKKIGPTCEIKLLLDSSAVLDEQHLLAADIREQFQISEEYQAIEVMYLDTPGRDYLNNGWINRIRVKEGKKPKYSLDYKIRYEVPDYNISQALDATLADGFTLYDSYFPAEIDWGYSKMTLSFTYGVSLKTEEMPELRTTDPHEAVNMIVRNMPAEEKNWKTKGWGKDTAADMQAVGPLRFLRYTGAIGEQEIRIEVWPVQNGGETQYITEFSIPCDSLESAEAVRDGVIETLDGLGILLHEDGMKTTLILNGLDAVEK